MIAGLYKIFDHWHKEGTVWIISDPHFDDPDLANIPGRPTAVELVKRINAKCGKKDTLICLGDVGDPSYIPLLRAKRKILIMGNHDAGRTNYERIDCRITFDQPEYTKGAALAAAMHVYSNCRYVIEEEIGFGSSYSWVVHVDNGMFDEVYEGPLMIGEKLILSHEPVDVPWAFNLHGHDHAGRKSDKRHFNCCCDVAGYEPINFNQWMKAGHLAHIETIHRDTIDAATDRKRKRGGKKIGER
jgi:calcineurin-like phosphoesterase family protein